MEDKEKSFEQKEMELADDFYDAVNGLGEVLR